MRVNSLSEFDRLRITSFLNSISCIEGAFLAGSASTDELLFENEVLISDVEIGVIYNRNADRKEIRSKLNLFDIGLDLEFFLVSRNRMETLASKNYSFRHQQTSILMNDVVQANNWLVEPKSMQKVSVVSSDIPLWEGYRLILNRLGEGALELSRWVEMEDDSIKTKRWVTKLLLAVGDSHLISSGAYEVGYGVRGEKFTNSFTHVPYFQEINSAYLVRMGKETEINFPYDAVEFITYVINYVDSLGMNITPTYRYQAPLEMFDPIYDSIMTLINNGRAAQVLMGLSALLFNGSSVQVYGYRRIFFWYQKLVAKELKHNEIDKILSEWNLYCK
jgi:hypothetical protein